MRVRWSRVLGVRRADPFRFSAGDEAFVEMGPGLLEFLSLRDARGGMLGDGLAPEWVIPIGAAGTAAFAVVCEEANPWTAVVNEVELIRACGPDETLLATASIDEMRRASVRIPYRVVSRERQDVVARGAFVFACVGPEGPRPYDVHLHRRDPEPPPAPETPASPPVVRAPAPRPAPSSASARLADALLPRSVSRALRPAYWHALSLRGDRRVSPAEFVRGFSRVLRSEEGPDRGPSVRSAASEPTPPAAGNPGPSLAWTPSHATLALGASANYSVDVFHAGPGDLEARLTVSEPFGSGLEAAGRETAIRLRPGETASWTVRVAARRPDEVHFGRPWPLTCRLTRGDVEIASAQMSVAVPDPNSGTIYYVLTEDCETFDGSETTGDYGDARVLGNHNGFMDPEDYRVQMIEKPNALNAIADRHGARWTHFWTATQRFAADWAARRSKTGAWDVLAGDLDASVRAGSARHEYAPHIHFDFEPDSALPPQPRLTYDAKTDGILPNEYYDPVANPDHKFHGWDGGRKGIANVRAGGDLASGDTKSGSLRKSVRYLAGLSFGGRASFSTRTGAADFGATPEDVRVSAAALAANGLLANADVAVYATPDPAPRGRQMYFCRAGDLDAEIGDLAEAALVELRAPEIMLEQSSAEDLNAWFDRRVRESQGPGVRAIVAMTHAMFMKGEPDPFRSLEGGDFDRLDHHLDHVRRAHPNVRFATASEAVLEFLDYYAPVPRAVTGCPIAVDREATTFLFPVRILGRGIPISRARPAQLAVQAPPLFDPDEIVSLEILEGGTRTAAAGGPFGTEALPSVRFEATSGDGYVLRVAVRRPRPELRGGAAELDAVGRSDSARFEELPEEEMPDLLRLDPPRLLRGAPTSFETARAGDAFEWRYPGGLFALLVHPVSGNAHPLGRRLHPYGRFSEGIAIDAALRLFGRDARPSRIDLRWVRPVQGGADFRLHVAVASAEPGRVVLSSSVRESGVEVARLDLTVRRATADPPA